MENIVPLDTPVPQDGKLCTHCQEIKNLSDFYKNKSHSSGYQSWCKSCANAQKKMPVKSPKFRPCTQCGESDPSQFYYLSNGSKKSTCKRCDIEQQKVWQKANPERQQERQKRWRDQNPGYQRQWAHGLSPEGYQAMFESQFGLCAICGQTPQDGKFHVDHCHASGVIRGLLCPHCNHMLGKAKDNPETLRKAAEYLILHST